MVKQTKTAKVLRQLKGRKYEPKTPIASEMFLPNQSGDHSAGRVRRTPSNETDIVNKAYVDNQGFITGVKLNEIENPDGNKTFNCAANSISFNFTNPTGQPTYDGAFEIQASGAFEGDLFHIHQHTGNPGTTDLAHMEASDDDVTVLRLNHTGTGNVLEVGDHGSAVLEIDESGNLSIPEYLYHTGDTDTYIQFDTDIINLVAHGSPVMNVNFSTATKYTIIFNSDGEDVDIIMESDDNPSMFFLDGNLNRIGINTKTPTATFSADCDAVFNESGEDVNSRVESANNANIIFVDAGFDKVGIGTGSPTFKLEVNGTFKAEDYYSGDGSPGITPAAINIVDRAGVTHTFTFKDGLLTAYSAA